MGMTVIEKILAKNSGQDLVKPGDLVVVKVGTAILYDNNFGPSIWRDIIEVYDRERVVVVFDHRVPAKDILSATAQKTGREFVKKFNIDPAIASSVFVTTITDVIGFLSFLGVGAFFFYN